MEENRDNRSIIDSFNNAVDGIMHIFRHERHFRVHMLSAIGVLLVSLFLDLARYEMIIIFMTVFSVLVAEMFNTAVERLVNMITREYHPLARIVKDIAAAAVFFSSINAIIVGYLIFFQGNHLENVLKKTVILKISETPEYITVIALSLLVILVIMGKVSSGRGRPFYGGMPSMHSALAFSIGMSALFISKSPLLVGLVFILAVMVAHSRVKLGVHTLVEVIAGSGLGILVTCILFIFFRWLLL